MLTKENTTVLISEIGENIGKDLGEQMIRDFRAACPAETPWYLIGRNVLESILSQPGCQGIRFYNAIDELSSKTLVYVAVDNVGKDILTFTAVNAHGQLSQQEAIVADRIVKPGNLTSDDWNWTID